MKLITIDFINKRLVSVETIEEEVIEVTPDETSKPLEKPAEVV